MILSVIVRQFRTYADRLESLLDCYKLQMRENTLKHFETLTEENWCNFLFINTRFLPPILPEAVYR